ncbi:MAG: thioredoxin family protein [Pirellulaceae bacterium]|nr:thioredoxin family protein [Pirellulaceae bacterium]
MSSSSSSPNPAAHEVSQKSSFSLLRSPLGILFILLFLFGVHLWVRGLVSNPPTYSKNLAGRKTTNLATLNYLGTGPSKEMRRGKLLVVDFWATWCRPCVNVIPHMNSTAEKYAESIIVVGASSEAEKTIRDFNKQPIEYYRAINSSALVHEFSIDSIPHIVIFNDSDVVVWDGHPSALTDTALDSLIAEHLAN